jgi:hypothetical protein
MSQPLLCCCVVTLMLLPGLALGIQKPSGKPADKPAPAKGKEKAPAPQLRPFKGKLSEARAHAKERNAGLLIHIILEGEADNDKYRDTLLKDPELLTACEQAVVVISNNGTHPRASIEVEIDGKKQKQAVCSVYPMFESCTQHAQHFNELFLEYREESGDLRCPQTILIGPDGKEALRIATGHTPELSEVLAGFDLLRANFGPGLTEEHWVSIVKLCADARQAQLAQNWPVCARAWDKVFALSPKSEYAKEAKAGREACEKGLRERFSALQAKLVPGSAATAYRELQSFEKDCTGLAIAAEIRARIVKAEAQKEIKEELALVRLEMEGEALLEQAQSCSDAGNAKELEKTLKKLFAKRLLSTAAARKALSLWPEHAPKAN